MFNPLVCSNYLYLLPTKFNHCAFWPSSLSLQKTQHRHNVFVSKCRYVYYIKAKCRCKKKQKSVLSWFKSCSNIFNAANVFKNEEEMYYLPLQNQNKHRWNQALSSHLVGKYNEYNLYLAKKYIWYYCVPIYVLTTATWWYNAVFCDSFWQRNNNKKTVAFLALILPNADISTIRIDTNAKCTVPQSWVLKGGLWIFTNTRKCLWWHHFELSIKKIFD